jgi:hypothetical protein
MQKTMAIFDFMILKRHKFENILTVKINISISIIIKTNIDRYLIVILTINSIFAIKLIAL